MSILKEKVKSVNYPCDIDYVDDSKKSLKICLSRAWSKKKKKQKYKKHQNVTFKKNIFDTHFSVKCLFTFQKKILEKYIDRINVL